MTSHLQTGPTQTQSPVKWCPVLHTDLQSAKTPVAWGGTTKTGLQTSDLRAAGDGGDEDDLVIPAEADGTGPSSSQVSCGGLELEGYRYILHGHIPSF